MKRLMSLVLKAAVVAAVTATSAAVSGGALARGNLAAGQAKAKQVCAACHGENGDKSLQPEYPTLAGQHADYIIRALKDYKSGARKNAIMGAQAQTLSPQDIQDVAAWFSSQKGPLQVKH
jgi:cytochrome c553